MLHMYSALRIQMAYFYCGRTESTYFPLFSQLEHDVARETDFFFFFDKLFGIDTVQYIPQINMHLL